MTRFSVAVLLVLALGATDGPVATRHLTLAASVSPAAAAPGSRVSLLLDVTPKPAMHVYAPDQKDYIPISLALEANAAVKAHVIQFPKAEKRVVEDLGETQLVYSRPFRIVQDVTLTSTAAAPLTIKGTLKYQACDESICYAPVTVPVAWTIDVKRPARVTR
jgi:DsbC/DsbD-like thiol-disulfide interchange protein